MSQVSHAYTIRSFKDGTSASFRQEWKLLWKSERRSPLSGGWDAKVEWINSPERIRIRLRHKKRMLMAEDTFDKQGMVDAGMSSVLHMRVLVKKVTALLKTGRLSLFERIGDDASSQMELTLFDHSSPLQEDLKPLTFVLDTREMNDCEKVKVLSNRMREQELVISDLRRRVNETEKKTEHRHSLPPPPPSMPLIHAASESKKMGPHSSSYSHCRSASASAAAASTGLIRFAPRSDSSLPSLLMSQDDTGAESSTGKVIRESEMKWRMQFEQSESDKRELASLVRKLTADLERCVEQRNRSVRFVREVVKVHGWTEERDYEGQPMFVFKLIHFALKSQNRLDLLHVKYLYTHRNKVRFDETYGPTKRNALHICAYYPSLVRMLEWFLDDGLIDPNLGDIYGYTPLHRASYIGNNRAVRILLDEGRTDVNRRGERGNNALMLAVMNDQPSVIPLLLEHGADMSAINMEGKTAVDIAESKGMAGILALLKRHEKDDQSSSDSTQISDEEVLSGDGFTVSVTLQ